MSKRQSDEDYKPNKLPKGTRCTPCRTRTREDTNAYIGYDSDSAISSIVVSEVGASKYYLQEESTTHVRKYDSGKMAKQDKSPLDNMMELLIKMREDDRKDRKEWREREQEREEKREEEDREREDRHHQLLQQIQDTQPSVPQTVHVSQTILPSIR